MQFKNKFLVQLKQKTSIYYKKNTINTNYKLIEIRIEEILERHHNTENQIGVITWMEVM